MSGGYLVMLDEILAGGVTAFSPAFLQRQIDFVLDRQQADGGFPGRLGASDLYYTDFALRTLTLLRYEGPALVLAGAYLDAPAAEPRDIVDYFSLLNSARLLRRPVRQSHAGSLSRLQLATGGYRRPGNDTVSAYQTFLAALCHELLEVDFPMPEAAAAAIAALQQADGGFADMHGEPAGQTNATAAALAFLRMQDALAEDTAAPAITFLAQMQCPDGGLRAHAAAAAGDLLSTFTGLLTLLGLDAADRIDLTGIARFLRASTLPTGGFTACPTDDEPDIEYTCYGTATLALLRVHVNVNT